MTEGELRVLIEQLRQEVSSLRDLTDEYVPRFSVVEDKVTRIDQIVERLAQEMVAMQLVARELSTNWKLAVALGALLGTFIIGVVLWAATSG